MAGYELVRTTFQVPLPYLMGFAAAARYLEAVGRPRTALCAVEIRVPRPLTMDEFVSFNADYIALLGEWGVLVDGQVPIARSNVAPLGSPPAEISLYGFSYVALSDVTAPSFFVSAAPEKADVRPGETTPDALREKAASAMRSMDSGLTALEVGWSDVTALSIYTHHDIHAFLDAEIMASLGPNAVHGLHWYYGPPPIVGLEFEVDVRAIRREFRL
ncbi:MAG: RidA family protein [Chloroflexi bacterium]|nr:RidA family protein [Chloroflexota bacterium]